MTLQEAKDQVAKDRGWSGYNEALVTGTEDELLYINDQAAEQYAYMKWHEGCEAQKQICSNLLNDWEFGGRSSVHHFKDAPKPEFK